MILDIYKDGYREPDVISEVIPILEGLEESELLREEAILSAKWFYPMFDFSKWGRRNIAILAIAIVDNCLALGEDGQVYFDIDCLFDAVDRAFRKYGNEYYGFDEPLAVAII